MKIADFKEYMAAIRSLYSGSSAEELDALLHDLKSASIQRENTKKKLQAELKKIRYRINLLRERIKQAQGIEDKIEASREIKEYQQLKKEFILKNKELEGVPRFEMLSPYAKTAACTDFLLKKYLTKEIVKNNPLGFKKNQRGDIVVDIKQLQNSHLYQEAAHIRDYVSSYINLYPHRVLGAGYFNGKLSEMKSWTELLEAADRHFDEINRKEKENKDKEKKVAESRDGIESVEIYASENLQAVRLLSENALKYEGREMGHCVGSYYNRVKNGTSQIYSLRDYNEEGELVPHVTIEVVGDRVVQIKGRSDKMAAPRYIKAARNLVMKLSGIKTLEKLKNTQNIPSSELENIGFIKDKNNKIQDILSLKKDEIELYNLTINGEDLNYLNLERLKVTELYLTGVLSQSVLDNLAKLKSLQSISLGKVKSVEGKSLDFGGLSEIKHLTLSSCDLSSVKKICLPENLQDLYLGKVKSGLDIVYSKNLKSLNISLSSAADIKYFEEKISSPILKIYVQDMDIRENLSFAKTSLLVFENCRIEEGKHIFVSENLQNLEVEESPGLLESIVFENQNNIKVLKSDDGSVFNSNVISPNLSSFVVGNVELDEKTAAQISEMSELRVLGLNEVSYHAKQPWIIPESTEWITFSGVDFDGILSGEKCSNLQKVVLIGCDLQNADVRLNTVLKQSTLNLVQSKVGIEFDFDMFKGVTELNVGSQDLSARSKELKFPETVETLLLGGWLPDKMTELDLTPYKKLRTINMGMMSGRNVEKIIFPENLVDFTFDEIGWLKSLTELDLSRCHKMTDWNETLLNQFTLIKLPETIKKMPWKQMAFNDNVRIELHANTPQEVVEEFKSHLGNKVIIGKKQQEKGKINLLPMLFDKCQEF